MSNLFVATGFVPAVTIGATFPGPTKEIVTTTLVVSPSKIVVIAILKVNNLSAVTNP